MTLDITIEDINGYPDVKLFRLKGDLDMLGSKEFSQKLGHIVENENYRVIIDCNEVKYINSTGIFHLVRFFTRLKAKGGYLKLIAVNNDQVKEILDIMGIMKLIPVYTNLTEALE